MVLRIALEALYCLLMRKFSKSTWLGLGSLLAAIVLAGTGFTLGLTVGKKMPQNIVVRGVTGINDASSTADFGTFWQAWKLIDDNYLKAKDVSSEDKVRGATAGLVASLGDPYSEYFDPESARSFKQDVQGSFSGIGAEIGIRSEQLVVISPLKGTPAEQAGLMANDKILLINGSSTKGLSIEKAVSLIRGPEGSTVKLTILRDGWTKTKDFSIVRKKVEAPTLDFKMLPGAIAYVQLYQFNANAERLFANAARQAAANNAQGMILDLRGNPGGYLDVAVNLAGSFVVKGSVVVKEEGRNGEILETLRADGDESLVHTPVVILIDKGSASASEILAGALQDIRGTKLIGETSFGKGTVQQFMDLRDGSTVKLTIAHWVLPSGRILDHDGLKPTHEVILKEEDVEKKRDPQLDKAIEVMKEEIRNQD
jgi:carboxyl-terminal processing protease